MNCGRPTAPAYEPLMTSGSMPVSRASSSSSFNSSRKYSWRRSPSKAIVASASMARNEPVLRAVRGFDAEDSEDHFGRNAEFRFGARQVFGVKRPEARAVGDQLGRQEFRAITRVRTRRRWSRARHRADQAHGRRRIANIAQDPLEVRVIDAVFFDHRLDERAHVRAREVIRARQHRLRREQARGEQERRQELRC